MNIRYLQDILSRIDEIKVIGKSATVDGVVCNVMGLIRHGMEMELLILQYDENFEQMIEESEETKLPDAADVPESNRMLMRADRRNDAINSIFPVEKVFIGEGEFKVYVSESGQMSTENREDILLLVQFLNNGWQPNGIDYQNINTLFLTRAKLEGDYISIPDFDSSTEIRFVTGIRSVSHQVEKPVTLIVGGEYSDRLWFQDADTGEEHWAQINRVYLLDMWAEMEKTFSNLKIQEKMTSEEFTRAKSDFEKHFLEICPRGMYFPIVEYECEEDISLQFYSKAYLDSKPLHRGSSMGFIVAPDQSTGILGLKLKAAVIQEPVSPDTSSIEVELFQYIRTISGREIVLK